MTVVTGRVCHGGSDKKMRQDKGSKCGNAPMVRLAPHRVDVYLELVGSAQIAIPHSWDSICQLETEHSTTTQRYISAPFTRFAEGPCNLKSSGLVVRRRRRHARP